MCKSHLKYLIGFLTLVLIAQPIDAQQKIYFSGGVKELSGVSQGTLKKYDVGFIPIIYQYAIDPDEKMKLSPELLLKELKQLFPGENDSGICVLDWEGKALEAIANNPIGSELYENTVSEFIKALRFVKIVRPNVKVGYFGINRVNIYKRDASWKKENDKLLPIYKESDILFPQVYHYYPYQVHDQKFDSLYVTDMMTLMISYGLEYKKPVMPFIWHRYFESKESINNNEFYNHVRFAVTAKYKNRKVDSAILWTGDEFWIASGDNVIKSEQGASSSDDYRNQNLNRYFNLMSKAINGR